MLTAADRIQDASFAKILLRCITKWFAQYSMQKHILSMYENSQIGTQQGLQADKHLLANQPDTVVVDKESKRTVVMDREIPAESNNRKKLQACLSNAKYGYIYKSIRLRITVNRKPSL